MTRVNPSAHAERFEPVAAALAFALPGAGHMFLGEVRRGLLVGAGVLGLFLSGLLIGGIDVVDRDEDFVWFLGQGLVGPLAFGVDWVHQNHFKVVATERVQFGGGREMVRQVVRSANPGEARDPATGKAVPAGPGQRPPNTKSIGRMNELGTLYTTIAGMLNLIAILDVLFYRPERGGRPQRDSSQSDKGTQ